MVRSPGGEIGKVLKKELAKWSMLEAVTISGREDNLCVYLEEEPWPACVPGI